MKIALICPSNILFMPYVDNYRVILDKENIEYDIINWDRLKIEDFSEFTYRDIKKGHKRNYIDYLKFKKFVINILKRNRYKNIIVFGLQLTHFLKGHLIKYYKDKYLIDIRDYNKILRISNMESVMEKSSMSVISSPGYLQWLPKTCKYVINHNVNIDSLASLCDYEDVKIDKKITISYTGTLTNFDENKKLIDNLKNNKNFNLIFNGDGIINNKIEAYISKHDIKNVTVNGRYQKGQEKEKYFESDLTNMLLYNNSINNRTCLANRVYKSVVYAKPMIALKGTYISKIITQYNLGLVLDSFENIDQNIINYLKNFDKKQYYISRINFLKKIINENKLFEERLLDSMNV